MYCPGCGSNNNAEVTFCTRCGTNLGVVSEALTGKLTGKPDYSDHVAKLMSDYYRGRKNAITGGVLILAALFIMTILSAAGMKPVGAFFIVFWMFIWGASALSGGLGKWLASSSELKSLGTGSQSRFQGASFHHGLIDSRAARHEDYSTGPVGHPGSVTEQTTRQLDDRGYLSRDRESEPGR